MIDSHFGWMKVEEGSYADWNGGSSSSHPAIEVTVYADHPDYDDADFNTATLTYKQARKLAYQLLLMTEG